MITPTSHPPSLTLEAAKARLKGSQSPALITDIEGEGKIRDVDQRWMEACGFSREELIGNGLSVIQGPETFQGQSWQRCGRIPEAPSSPGSCITYNARSLGDQQCAQGPADDMFLLDLLPFNDDDDDDNGYDEGFGDSCSSIGFTNMKLGVMRNVSGSLSRSDSGTAEDMTPPLITLDAVTAQLRCSQSPALITNSKGKVRDVNLRWLEAGGLSREELIDHDLSVNQGPRTFAVQPLQPLQPLQPQQSHQDSVLPFRSMSFPGAEGQPRRQSVKPAYTEHLHLMDGNYGVPLIESNRKFICNLSTEIERMAPGISTQTPDTNGQKIKLPMNAYMLWLQENRKASPGESSLTHEADKCTSMGERWKTLNDAEKAVWFERATEAKKQHQKSYPNWKYSPSTPKKKAQKWPRGCSSPAGKSSKRTCKKKSCENIVGFNFGSSGHHSRSSSSDGQCDGLLEQLASELKPNFMEGQDSSMRTFQTAALPANEAAQINSMIIPLIPGDGSDDDALTGFMSLFN